jgi:tetratricopeptide (TPR) repeat protein
MNRLAFVASIVILSVSKPHDSVATPSMDLLLKSQTLIDRDQNDAALACLNKLIEKQPSNAQAYSERSRVYVKTKKYELALVDSNKAVRLEPELAIAYANRGIVYLVTARYREALDDCSKAIRLDPQLARAYQTRALVYERLKRYKEEIQDCNQAISIEPNSFKNYLYRATAYTKLEKNQKALQDCDIAVGLAPDKAVSYVRRGYVYICLREFQKAVKDYTTAIKIDSQSAEAYLLRSDAFGEMGQYQQQLEDLGLAIKLNPKNVIAYVKRGYTLSQLGQLQNALLDYSSAVKVDPKCADAYLRRADVYGELGQFQSRINDLTSVCKISHNNAGVFEKRAKTYYRLGQLKNAIADCTTAISLNHALSSAYSIAADSYEELGQYRRAIEFRTKAIEFDEKNASEWNCRADDYNRLRNFDMAKADWKKARELATPTHWATMQLCNPLIDFDKFFVLKTTEQQKDSINIKLKNNPVVVPFDYCDGSHICMPIRLNGRSLRLMLDTGSAHSDLWNQATHSTPNIDKAQLLSTDAHGKAYYYDLFKAKELKLGHLSLFDVLMTVDDGLVGHKTLSGFLGGNILENFVVTIDYSKKQISFALASMNVRPLNAIVVPMTMIRSHRPYCSVRIDKKIVLSAILDTGSPFSLVADSLLSSILPNKLQFKEHRSGPWLGNLSTSRVRVRSLSLGAAKFEVPILDVFPAAQAPSMATEVVLGNDFLSTFKTVSFDYPGRQVILEPK